MDITAETIVRLIRTQNWKNGGVHSVDEQEAIDLVVNYAKVVAGAAVHIAMEEAHARTMAILGAPAEMPLAPMTKAQAEDMTRRSV